MLTFFAALLAGGFPLVAQSLPLPPPWVSDQGDGTYANPPLYADYPDPDVIRVGSDFFLVTTTFVNSPGLRLLKSKDLVNWQIVANVIPRLEGRKEYDLASGGAYRQGVFAPSMRYHGRTFYIAVTPVGQNTRIYRSQKPEGPWTQNELGIQAFDPALHIEPDGTGTIATSGGWDGTLTLHKLSADFSKVVASKVVFFNKGAEGSKIVKKGDTYYLFQSIPSGLWLSVSRAKNLYGPWERKESPSLTEGNGGHQGAIVELADGSWYGFVMRDFPSVGRMTNISPIFWQDGWPVWGTPDQPNRVPARSKKPVQGQKATQPDASDDFESAQLGLQWAWNHNPDATRWSLSERPGFLRLRPTQADGIWTARNTLTQKGQGPASRGETKLDVRNLKPGTTCGFGTLGKFCGYIALRKTSDGQITLTLELVEDTGRERKTEIRSNTVRVDAQELWLRTELDFLKHRGQCQFSLDGRNWSDLGEEFPLAFDWRTGTFQGQQFAIFCFSATPSEGHIDVDWFRLSGLTAPTSETN